MYSEKNHSFPLYPYFGSFAVQRDPERREHGPRLLPRRDHQPDQDFADHKKPRREHDAGTKNLLILTPHLHLKVGVGGGRQGVPP